MKCYYHSENDAIGTCTNCGKAICQIDAVNVSGKLICKECLEKGATLGTKTANTTPTNALAVISLILGILGLGGCCCGGGITGIIFGLPASITGWIARKQILESKQNQQGMTLATLGLIFGVVQVFVAVLFLLIWGTGAGYSIIMNYLQQFSH